jgi:hypothetical protein
MKRPETCLKINSKKLEKPPIFFFSCAKICTSLGRDSVVSPWGRSGGTTPFDQLHESEESFPKGFFIGEIMKKFKYFGRSYDDVQTLIDRVSEDLAGIGLEVVDYRMTVINNNQYVRHPIYGTTYIQAGREELVFNLKCFVRPAIFDAIDFHGYCKIDEIYFRTNLLQLIMGFGCYKGQPFERVAEFLMQNNHLGAA